MKLHEANNKCQAMLNCLYCLKNFRFINTSNRLYKIFFLFPFFFGQTCILGHCMKYLIQRKLYVVLPLWEFHGIYFSQICLFWGGISTQPQLQQTHVYMQSVMELHSPETHIFMSILAQNIYGIKYKTGISRTVQF